MPRENLEGELPLFPEKILRERLLTMPGAKRFRAMLLPILLVACGKNHKLPQGLAEGYCTEAREFRQQPDLIHFEGGEGVVAVDLERFYTDREIVFKVNGEWTALFENTSGFTISASFARDDVKYGVEEKDDHLLESTEIKVDAVFDSGREGGNTFDISGTFTFERKFDRDWEPVGSTIFRLKHWAASALIAALEEAEPSDDPEEGLLDVCREQIL